MLLTPQRSDDVRNRVQEAVEQALLERDISARRASLDVVGNDGLIRDIRAGRMPGLDRLEALFEYLGLEVYFGPPRKRAEAAEPAQIGRRADGGVNYLTIPWHVQSHRIQGAPAAPVAFSRSWLTQCKLDPSGLAAVKLDAEEPDLLLVDTMAPRQGGPSLWCFREGARVALARVQFDPGSLIFLPDTREGRVRLLMGQERNRISLLGQVVWSGRLRPEA
jgi:hypothetical protein